MSNTHYWMLMGLIAVYGEVICWSLGRIRKALEAKETTVATPDAVTVPPITVRRLTADLEQAIVNAIHKNTNKGDKQ